MAWIFRRKICGWDWSKPRRARSATSSTQVLLYCYHYDPATGKYGAIVSNILKLGGGVTILFLAGLILVLLRLERIRPAQWLGSG